MSHQYLNPASEIVRLRLREVSVTEDCIRFTRRGQRELYPPHPSVESVSSGQRSESATGLPRQNPMSGFQAINAPNTAQVVAAAPGEDDPIPDSDDELPDPSTLVRPIIRPTAERQPLPDEPSDICGVTWPVDDIKSKRTMHGRREWLIKWKPSTLREKDIRRRLGCHDYVRCDGNDFDISSDSPASPSEDGKPQRLVVWVDTWRFIGDLRNDLGKLWKLMQAYELLHPETNGVEPGAPANGLPVEEELALSEYARTKIREAWNRKGAKKGLKLLSLVETAPKRPLIFRPRAVGLERTINFGDPKGKANALLIYDTAVEQPEPCDRCEGGNGPFPTCVVDDKFHHGACASCIFEREGPRCNFSKKYEGENYRQSVTAAPVHDPESEREASAAPTASTVAIPSFRSSPELPHFNSQDTNPTSPAPSLSHDDGDYAGDVELEGLPCFARVQQEADRATGESSRASPSSAEIRSALTPLTSSKQNARLLRGNVCARDEGSPALDRGECGLVSAQSNERKRKREGSPSDRTAKSSLAAKLPFVEDLSFRHPACAAHGPCTDGRAGYKITWAGAGPSKLPHTVYRPARFAAAEATDAQIKFIIGCCPCPYAAYFQAAWTDYCTEKAKQGKKRKRTKECHLSKRFSIRINGVISNFCPIEPQPSPTDEAQLLGSAGHPIFLDDEDD